jgi:hypothetical protein
MSIPNSLKLINAAEVSSAVVSRRNTTIYPTGSQDVDAQTNGGNVIEFKLPVSNESIDMSTFFMHFNFQIYNKTAAQTCYVEDSIESIIDQVTVYIGNTGQEIERIGPGYNRLESALNYYISDSFVKSIGGSMFYTGLSRDERISLYSSGATTGNTVQCSVPLRLCGVANPNFIMPSQIFGQSSFLIVRIRLASPQSCLLVYTEGTITVSNTANSAGDVSVTARTAASNTPSYKLSNIRASFDLIQTSQDYQNQISQFLASSSLVYPVKTWDVDFRAIDASLGRTSFTENLSYNYRDIESIFFWFNKQSELNTYNVAGEDRLWVPNNISSLQLTINGSKVPSIPIDLSNGATEGLCHTLVALGALHVAEHVGPFNFEHITSNFSASNISSTTASGVASITLPIYSQVSSNRHYGRNKTAPSESVLASRALSISTAATLNPYAVDTTPSYFLIGLNMRKLLDLPNGELSGLNLQNTSGSIGYELKFSAAPGASEIYSMGVAVLHNRFISLSGAGVTVDI